VSRAVLLDAGPLGLLVHPRNEGVASPVSRWLAGLRRAGAAVFVPEIADYEVRRELLRLRSHRSLDLPQAVHDVTEYLPINTDAMRRAADVWAVARQTGQPTAGDDTIDADMILIGQAQALQLPDAIIATTNVGHLTRFFPADLWSNVSAG
jgi:predicted nucleic acid-binding protein